jgi:putative IMPACT (imprinted ancient) family translation regulator
MIQLENYEELGCILQFADESSLRRLCDHYQVTIVSVHYEQEINMQLRLRTKILQKFKQVAHDLLRGHLHWTEGKSIYHD